MGGTHSNQPSADFTILRYAQVWEDADVLVEALDIRPADVCLSIGSAGDNALALLARGAARVVAVDMNPAQIACIGIRAAAYRHLAYGEFLELIGSRPGGRAPSHYASLRPHLGGDTRAFWDVDPARVLNGIGHAGKFENYFRLFRERALPLVHSRRTIDRLLMPRDQEAREKFYDSEWDTWRWRGLFGLFFSRTVMGALGRDPALFQYVEGSVADRILSRTRHALRTLDPSGNPYLHWILKGCHSDALPLALREDAWEAIRGRLDRFEWHQASLGDYLDGCAPGSIDKFNLSDIFEYLSPEATEVLYEKILRAARPGARLVYWNMLAPRSVPGKFAGRVRSLDDMAGRLFQIDRAFFYSALVVEELL